MEDSVASVAARADAHAIAGDLARAIQPRHVQEFNRVAKCLRELDNSRREAAPLDGEVIEIRRTMRGFMEELVESSHEPYWDDRVERLQDAWRWDQARYWLEEHTRKDDMPSLVQRARQVEEEINATIAKLASLHAWSYCFSRLTESHRRNLKPGNSR